MPARRSAALDAFDGQWRARPADALAPLRGHAMQRFLELGLPTARDDSGRYTNLRSLTAQAFTAAAEGGALTYGKHALALTPTTDKQMYEAMLTGPTNMPVFSDAQLTPQQKLDIIADVQTIKAQPDPGGAGLGRLGPVPEGLVAWLVGIGLVVGVTLWIGSRA